MTAAQSHNLLNVQGLEELRSQESWEDAWGPLEKPHSFNDKRFTFLSDAHIQQLSSGEK